MKSQSFLPESMYSLDSTMTLEKIYKSIEENQPLTGRVLRLNLKNLDIDLGGGILYSMPFNEFTIYPIYRESGSLSPNVYAMVGRKIRAKVTINDDGSFKLSRKAHMLEALQTLKNESDIAFAQITSFSKLSAFIDIGAGLVGKINPIDFAPVHYRNVRDIGLCECDIIPLKIMKYIPETNHFQLSRIQTFDNPEDALKLSTIVICQIFDRVENDPTHQGYYALVDGKYSGIVDCEFIPLKYGDKVAATIRKIHKPKDNRCHIHLSFVNMIW